VVRVTLSGEWDVSTKEKNLSLYELSEEALALDDLAAMDDGEWLPELEELATGLIEKLVEKADAFGGYVRDLEAREEILDAEIKRLSDRKKRVATRITWMKSYGCTVLQRMGRPRIEGTRFTLALQNNPPRVDVTVLPDALPPEYVRVIPEQREPDKKALLQALKGGADIPGVSMTQTQSLRIR
jgi:hypothetical protein